MPYEIRKMKCKDSEGKEGGWAVVKADTDQVVACSQSRGAALAAMAARYANLPETKKSAEAKMEQKPLVKTFTQERADLQIPVELKFMRGQYTPAMDEEEDFPLFADVGLVGDSNIEVWVTGGYSMTAHVVILTDDPSDVDHGILEEETPEEPEMADLVLEATLEDEPTDTRAVVVLGCPDALAALSVLSCIYTGDRIVKVISLPMYKLAAMLVPNQMQMSSQPVEAKPY